MKDYISTAILSILYQIKDLFMKDSKIDKTGTKFLVNPGEWLKKPYTKR